MNTVPMLPATNTHRNRHKKIVDMLTATLPNLAMILLGIAFLTTLLSSLHGIRAARTAANLSDDAASGYLYNTPDATDLVLDHGWEGHDFTKSSAPKVVEFYDPMCGACQAFKSNYVEVARKVAASKKPGGVEFYGVSCQLHRDLCNQYGGTAVPKIFAFANGGHTPEEGVEVPKGAGTIYFLSARLTKALRTAEEIAVDAEKLLSAEGRSGGVVEAATAGEATSERRRRLDESGDGDDDDNEAESGDDEVDSYEWVVGKGEGSEEEEDEYEDDDEGDDDDDEDDDATEEASVTEEEEWEEDDGDDATEELSEDEEESEDAVSPDSRLSLGRYNESDGSEDEETDDLEGSQDRHDIVMNEEPQRPPPPRPNEPADPNKSSRLEEYKHTDAYKNTMREFEQKDIEEGKPRGYHWNLWEQQRQKDLRETTHPRWDREREERLREEKEREEQRLREEEEEERQRQAKMREMAMRNTQQSSVRGLPTSRKSDDSGDRKREERSAEGDDRREDRLREEREEKEREERLRGARDIAAQRVAEYEVKREERMREEKEARMREVKEREARLRVAPDVAAHRGGGDVFPRPGQQPPFRGTIQQGGPHAPQQHGGIPLPPREHIPVGGDIFVPHPFRTDPEKAKKFQEYVARRAEHMKKREQMRHPLRTIMGGDSMKGSEGDMRAVHAKTLNNYKAQYHPGPELSRPRNMPDLRPEAQHPSVREKVLKHIPIVKRAYKRSQGEETLNDAALSFTRGLLMGVFKSNEALDYKRKAALVDWFDLLRVSLPPEIGLHELIDTLKYNIDSISQRHEDLLMIINKHPLPDSAWSKSCTKGMKNGGFFCGFWKLLHVMSVGFAEQGGGLYLQESSPSIRVFSPKEAGDVVREYMALFFNCAKCSSRFLAQYDDCSFHRCHRLKDETVNASPEMWREFPLWLWQVHNDVSRSKSVRAQEFHEKEGRREEARRWERDMKAVYPHIDQCYTCVSSEGTWKMNEVYNHLEREYWTFGNELDPKMEKMLEYKYKESGRSNVSHGLWTYVLITIVMLLALFAKKYRIRSTGWHKKVEASSFDRLPGGKYRDA